MVSANAVTKICQSNEKYIYIAPYQQNSQKCLLR